MARKRFTDPTEIERFMDIIGSDFEDNDLDSEESDNESDYGEKVDETYVPNVNDDTDDEAVDNDLSVEVQESSDEEPGSPAVTKPPSSPKEASVSRSPSPPPPPPELPTGSRSHPSSRSRSPSPSPSPSSCSRGRGRGRGTKRGRGTSRGKGTSRGRGRGRGGGRKAAAPAKKRKTATANPPEEPPNNPWKAAGRKDRREFIFTGKPGINILPYDSKSPLSVLHLFLPNSEIEKFVKYTNKYADVLINDPAVQERVADKERTIFKTWKETNRDELWMYITITLMMGIIRKPEYDMYWTNDPLYATPIFTRLMSRTRFKELRKMIHFSDSVNFDPNDPLLKLRSMLDGLAERFAAVYTPERNLAIDEYLSLWKGRLSFRIYIPSKRERYGIKIYMNCESSSGYLLGFIIYTGSETNYGDAGTMVLPKTFDEYKTPSKVCLSLLRKYVDQGYTVTLDNLYTSPELAVALFDQTTDCFGTLRKKEALPHDFWFWKPVKGEEPKIRFNGDTMVLRWDDVTKTKKKKIVSMLSTMHTGKLIDSSKVSRQTQLPVMKPDVIVDYNKTMGGVDTLSRVIIPYNSQRRGLKWYRKLAELFIEIACYNSFILWKKLNPDQAKVDNLRFRKLLIEELITFYSHGYRSHQTGPLNPGQNPMRLTEKHFITPVPNVNSKKKYPQRNCVRCSALGKRKDTRYWCSKCQVGLCIDTCFEVYHTLKDITRNLNAESDSDE